jgi:hypothetical protein
MKKQYEYILPPHKVTYEELAVVDLKIDFEVQRTLSPARAQAIADNMVPSALGVITVSRRKVTKGQVDGPDQQFIVDDPTRTATKHVQHRGRTTTVVYEDYVMDGHHRVWACAAADPPITHVMCEVHHGLAIDGEGTLFLLKNKESWKPNQYEEYKVGLRSGIDLFVNIQTVLDKHNLKMGQSSSQNVVGSVATYVRLAERNGTDALDRALSISEAAFTRATPAWNNGYVIEGINRFIAGHDGTGLKIDAELPTKLNKVYHGLAGSMVAGINSRAQSQGTGATGQGSRGTAAYQLCVLAWNHGRANSKKLPTPW